LELEFSQTETQEQAAFRAGGFTIDHIFCLKQTDSEKIVADQPQHLLYVDLEKHMAVCP